MGKIKTLGWYFIQRTPKKYQPKFYAVLQRLRFALKLLYTCLLSPHKIVSFSRQKSLKHYFSLAYSLLIIADENLKPHQIQELERRWPGAKFWRPLSGEANIKALEKQIADSNADYVLFLANAEHAKPSLLSQLCQVVACNSGFDIWLSGARIGFWSWNFNGFKLDQQAILLMRSSLINRYSGAARNRRNATRIAVIPVNELQPIAFSTANVQVSGISTLIEELPFASPRTHPLAPQSRLSVVIPTRDRADLLAQAVRALEQQTLSIPIELVVVDNGSSEPGTFTLFHQLEQGLLQFQRIRDERPFNFSALCNQGIAASSGSMILLLNNDVALSHAHSLAAMLELARLETVGCVGAYLNYPNGEVQHLGVELTGELVNHQFHHEMIDSSNILTQRSRQVSAVTAACMMFRRSLWDELSGLDENLPVDFNDVDFCLRAQEAGFANIVSPHAQATHLESASRGRSPDSSLARGLNTMKARWSKHVNNDPFSLHSKAHQ